MNVACPNKDCKDYGKIGNGNGTLYKPKNGYFFINMFAEHALKVSIP
ncbi:MAG: hypothetical protein LBB45_01195 [Methanobrevibacter sp.]|nr:hypothetical protein [Candidatus Methanovirga basalitermitum]